MFFSSAAYEVSEHVSSPPRTKEGLSCVLTVLSQVAKGAGESSKMLPSPPSLGTSSPLTEVHFNSLF